MSIFLNEFIREKAIIIEIIIINPLVSSKNLLNLIKIIKINKILIKKFI
jgi:hypothetical protein